MSERPVIRMSAEEVFPLENETSERYYKRMKELESIVKGSVGGFVKAKGIPHDEPQFDGRVSQDVYDTRMQNSQNMDTDGPLSPDEMAELTRLGQELARAIMGDAGVGDVATGEKHGDFVLSGARDIVYGPREHLYGHASINFQRVADLWKVVFRTDVAPMQVGLGMIQMKVSRLMNLVEREAAGGQPATFAEVEDGFKDIAGYAEATMRALYENPDGSRKE